MLLRSYKTIFVTIGLIGVILLASPTIALLIKVPSGQQFSGIYILGSDHTLGNVPFNVKQGVSYIIYLGVNNNLGSAGYYSCNLKLLNESESFSAPNSGQPSSIPPLCEYKLFLDDGATWEAPLVFKVNTLSFDSNSADISSVNINGIDYQMNATSTWDSNKTGFYYSLVVELWLFNATEGISQYNDRFVSLFLNMTQ
ncbi:MAG TPA: DUF1616 domain-containing protein [Candidatus Acidoferrum sp.]|nr:DUF1616 domain-containing protein [Candidatus Acidoferrum sp.]